MALDDAGPAIRKRAQITRANKVMLVWVAIASVVVGFAAVGSVFLFQRLLFNEKVLSEKRITLSNLRHNNDSVAELENAIRALGSNEALLSSRSNSDDNALQVVLDALPSEGNSLAFGASLQDRLLSGVSGLQIESIQVDPVAGIETDANDDDFDVSSVNENDEVGGRTSVITFQFTVIGSQNQLRELLERLERSIRTIEITSLSIESREAGQAMQVSARVFYQPEREMILRDKVVQP